MTDLLVKLGPWSWLIAGFVLMALEMMAPGVFMFWLGAAAVVTGLLSFAIDWSWQAQCFAFAILSLAAVPLWRRFARARSSDSDNSFLNRRSDALVGQVFTLENLNPIDHPGCPFGSTADVLALVSAVNRPQLRINLDLYHTQVGEGDLIRWCRACLPWIGEVQVADNPGRCEPGTGEINYAGVARALKGMGYSGPVGMEAFAAGEEEAALEAFRMAFTV